MTFKETLFFVGRCLTINHDPFNKLYVSEKISNNSVDWDKIVQVSTAHYVLPALYINLKRADLLGYLPKELVNYMNHITSLNRDRNLEIIKQAKEINSLLKKNGMTPIFLKGTSFLLQGLYFDLAERMVGDIDLIVSKNEFRKAILILIKNGYRTKIPEKDIFFPSIHHPKMTKNNAIAPVEIHNQLILKPKDLKFDYEKLLLDSINFGGIHYPSISHQIIHNCINKQISDKGVYFKSIAFRNSYDLFLLSLNSNKEEVNLNKSQFSNIFNVYLGITKKVLNTNVIRYSSTRSIEIALKIVWFLNQYPVLLKLNIWIWFQYFRFKRLLIMILRSFVYKKYRIYLLKRLKVGFYSENRIS